MEKSKKITISVVVALVVCVAIGLGIYFGVSQKSYEQEGPTIYVEQANRLIKSYTAEELGISEEDMANAHYLRDDKIYERDGKKYRSITLMKIVESEVTNPDGSRNVEGMDNILSCYVAVDGSKAYKLNYETGELEKLPVKDLPELSEDERAQEDDRISKLESKPNIEF